MTLSLLKPFFYLTPPPSLPIPPGYNAHSFFNQIGTYAQKEYFSIIYPASADGDKLLIGQSTIDATHQDLIKKPGKNALIISCNEYFESAAADSFFKVIAPYTWAYPHTAHHHLPLASTPNQENLFLITHTLEQMSKVHRNKGTIYIHHQSNRSSSALLTTLFTCISNEQIKQQLITAQDTQEIERIVGVASAQAEIPINEAQRALGIAVLQHYKAYWNNKKEAQERVTTLEKKIMCFNALSTLAQSSEYKFIWDQAYKNPDIFPIVQNFTQNLYQLAEKKEQTGQVFTSDQLIDAVLAEMEHHQKQSDKRVILQLQTLYRTSEELMQTISFYPKAIEPLGLDLLKNILKSEHSYVKKIELLLTILTYVKNPSAEHLKTYHQHLKSSLVIPNDAMQIIGVSMMILGTAIAITAVVASCLASGGIFTLAMASLGACTLGAFSICIGKLMYDWGCIDEVAQAAYVLAKHIAYVDFDELDGSSQPEPIDPYCANGC